MSYRNRTPRLTASQRRHRAQSRIGFALIAAAALGFAALIGGAAYLDAAHASAAAGMEA